MPKIHKSRILFEDEHLLAVDKLSRELVVRGKGEMQKLPLLDFLRQIYGPDLKALHRLDYETSGVILFAKTKECYDQAIEHGKFFDDQSGIKKTYVAIVGGRMTVKNGLITKPLPARTDKELLESVTKYNVLEIYANASLVEAEITSGRHHQIRKHFASIKHALILDDEYGDFKQNRRMSQSLGFKHFFLHARSISFKHFITGKPMHIEAPLPKNFILVLNKLRKRA